MNNNGLSTGQKIMLGIVALIVLVIVGGASFALGMVTDTFLLAEPETIEVEVTREVEVVREVPVEVEVEVPVQVEVTVPAESGQTAETAAPTPTAAAPLPPPLTDLSAEDLDLFWRVVEQLEEDFDGDLPDETTLNYALIEATLATLDDPYTRFLDPELAARERESLEGAYEGIGAFVRENDDGFIEITRPIDNQPAQRAGLLPGDLILGIDGEDIIGQTLDEAISKVRGPGGTVVRLLIGREGVEPFEVTITRARIEIPIIETAMIGDVAYLRLSTFAAFNLEESVLQAVTELMAQNPSAFILDLRDNPGGFLDASVAIADIFLPESVVLYERSNNGNFDTSFTADDGDIAEDIPLVVLVNGGSASASELVAGALRDNGRAILIGEQTFGKGSVQQIRSLPDGSELRITIARWYTPANANINGEGLAPDIVVPLDPPNALLGSEDDNQLQRALDYINNGE
ncbi:MAG: S41 family peptidase [Chloroflexi bacterium]|nr:S41 family peptidase [Chloroflexota bacterium]